MAKGASFVLFYYVLSVACLLLYSFIFPDMFFIIKTLHAIIYVAPNIKAGAISLEHSIFINHLIQDMLQKLHRADEDLHSSIF